MVHKFTAGVIDLAPFGRFDAEGLDGGDDHHRPAIIVRALRVEGFTGGQDADVLPKPLGEGLAERVRPILKRLQRLFADGVRRDQPQHARVVDLQEGVGRDADQVRRDHRLTATGGQPKAGVGYAGKPLHGLIGAAGAFVEGGVRIAGFRRVRQPCPDRFQGGALIVLQVECGRRHVRHPRADREPV